MKNRFLQVCLASSLTAASMMANAQHLWWNDPGCGDIMEMMVRITNETPTTYYETLGWNQGAQAGGYTGLQTTTLGNSVIFSLWNPTTPVTKSITAPYVNPQGIFTPFGGEGTGFHYLNYNYNWVVNQWYRQVVRAWQYNGDTYFGMWLYDVTNNVWSHQITMDFPVANQSFCASAVSFLENYGSTDTTTLRRGYFTGGWKRLANGQWHAFNSAYVDGSLNEYGTAVVSGYNTLFMQTGTYTTNNFSYYNINFANKIPPYSNVTSTTYVASQNTEIYNSTVTYTWTIDPSDNPQFSYQIELVDTSTNAVVKTISDINPETRSVTFTGVTTLPANVLVIANITDIYDIEHSNSGW